MAPKMLSAQSKLRWQRLAREMRMQFGTLLRDLRVKANLTQEQLADLAGISLGSLRNHEQGHRLPSWGAVVKLAKALGVTTDTFAECDEVSEPEPAAKPSKARKGKK